MNKKGCLAIVAAAVLILASSCTANQRPIITGLEAEPDYWTAPLGSLQVTCNASDFDGDALSYNWSASGGDIIGMGAAVNWIAPEEVGMYDITVMVIDGNGGNSTGLIALVASNGPPPVIEDLIVTAEHKYLKKTTTGYKVGKTQEYNIECVASSNTSGELIYEWSCTGGEISGEGSMILWTAPDTAGDVTVTVKVFDGLGNWVRKSVFLEVVSCSSCTFG